MVLAGVNTGLAIFGLLTPVVGAQLNVVALVVVVAVTDEPGQMLVLLFTVSVRLFVAVMVTGTVLAQAAALVMVAI